METAHELIVRPYASQDGDCLLPLMRDVWSYKPDVDQQVQDRWWWQWPTPPLFVVEDPATGALAGLCAYIPFTLRAGGAEWPAAWFVDFYVRQAYQGQGLGKRLTQAVQAQHVVTASLSQTAMAYRVFQKLGWTDRAPVVVYMHPLPRRWMFPSTPAGHRLVAGAVDASLPVWPDVDALWCRTRDAFQGVARRTSADLLARYASQRGRHYDLVCAYRDDALVGYMIVRVVDSRSSRGGAPHGLIVDYLVPPSDEAAFGAVLSGAGSVLTGRGVGRIFAMSTLPACQRALRARGFLAPSTPVLGRWLAGNTKWLTYTAKAGLASPVPAQWHLTLGDCDLDYAWVRS